MYLDVFRFLCLSLFSLFFWVNFCHLEWDGKLSVNLEVSEFLGSEPKGGAAGFWGRAGDKDIRRGATRLQRTITHSFYSSDICKSEWERKKFFVFGRWCILREYDARVALSNIICPMRLGQSSALVLVSQYVKPFHVYNVCVRRPQYLHSVEHPLWRCHHIFFLICWMHGLDRCQNYDKLMLML